MARYGAMFGPDITFLGVDRCDWAEPDTYAGADVVILTGSSVDPYNPKVVRATTGSLFHLAVVTGVTVEAALAGSSATTGRCRSGPTS